MKKIIFTPKKRYQVHLYWVIYFISRPFSSCAYYTWNLKRGAYPTNADSISIPIFQEILGLIIIVPLAMLGILWITKNYPGKVNVFINNSKRPLWSLVWTILFISLIIISLLDIIRLSKNFTLPSIIDIVSSIIFILLVSYLRVLVVLKEKMASKKESNV